jgi:hypothetical protein
MPFLKRKHLCNIFGEPTGGKPIVMVSWRFTLKNSGLTVCYSTKYYKIIEDDTLHHFPDVNIVLL